MKPAQTMSVCVSLFVLMMLQPAGITGATEMQPTRPIVEPDDSATYFPPPESEGGWRKLESRQSIRRVAGVDPAKLDELKTWLLDSDRRDFAAVVVRRGYVVLEVERGNSAKTDSRRVASVSKAVCATVLAIASQQSQQGLTPRKMKFDDRAFDFIPWAHPLSDPRKARITVKQLLNHTSGLCPEATGAQPRHVAVRARPKRRPAHAEAGVRPRRRVRLLDARAGPCRAGV
jgi:CubicO group peptidase (beta-lactamase class C family)